MRMKRYGSTYTEALLIIKRLQRLTNKECKGWKRKNKSKICFGRGDLRNWLRLEKQGHRLILMLLEDGTRIVLALTIGTSDRDTYLKNNKITKRIQLKVL